MEEDDGFNPCECVWSTQAIQRLINMLRDAQNICTENICYDEGMLPGPPPVQRPQLLTYYINMTMILGVIAVLYVLRPNSLRRVTYDSKPRDDASGSNDDPPVPPPSAN